MVKFSISAENRKNYSDPLEGAKMNSNQQKIHFQTPSLPPKVTQLFNEASEYIDFL